MSTNEQNDREELRRRLEARKARAESGGAEQKPSGYARRVVRWYEKPGWIIALLVLFFPVGIFLMFRYTDWDAKVKGGVCAAIAVLCVFNVMTRGREPVDNHEHEWLDATCVAPKTCSVCGETRGSSLASAHQWVDATCSEPRTCSICGETSGNPASYKHEWVSATCTEPKTCSICGDTDGEPRGHSFNEFLYTVTREATCTAEGIKTYECMNECGETKTEAIPMKEHSVGGWQEVSRTSSDVTYAKYCENCNTEIERKTESVNPLIDADIAVYDVYSGGGETLGKRAEIRIGKDALKSLSQEQFFEFCRDVVEGSGYNWFTIVCEDGTGISFTGSDITVPEYGGLDDMGRVVEHIGYIRVRMDGTCEYPAS